MRNAMPRRTTRPESSRNLEKKWTLDQIRGEILKRSYVRALATGDFESGRKTIAQEMNVKKTALDAKKLSYWEKSEQAQAFEFCLAETKGYPEVMEKFRVAFDSLDVMKTPNDRYDAPPPDPSD